MNNEKDNNNFILQATILAAAGMISRVIGLLYRSPLQRVIGNLGIGYYSSAYNFYTIILLISSYSIPSAISKVIAQKLAVKEYKNAHRIFLGALMYVLVVGAAAGLFLFFGAGFFVSPEAVPVLQTFAPTIFFYGILGVLRGYFQAHKTMVQTSISQILEQIANAIVSVGMAYILIKMAFGSLEIPLTEAAKVQRGIRGAVGSAMGTGAGVFVALIFMAIMFFKNKPQLRKNLAEDTHEQVESYAQIFKIITLVVTPFIINTAIYNLSATVNNSLYTKIFPAMKQLDTVKAYYDYGVFSQAVTISNIPIAFASAMAAAMIPMVAQLTAANKIEEAKVKIGTAVKTTMIISIPCAVGICVLARPVSSFLFSNKGADEDLITGVLMALSLSILFYALSTLNSQILQGLGKVNAPIINAGIALIIQTVIAVGLLYFTSLDLYAIAIANTLYSGMMCVLNQWSVRKAIGYKQEFLTSFLIPIVAAGIMGIVALLMYNGLRAVTKSFRISLIGTIPVAALLYFIFLIRFKGVTKDELRGFPKGHLLVKLAVKCHLMH